MAKKGTLKYRKVSRTPQIGKDAGKKRFYAVAVQDRTVEFDDFVTHISDHNSPYSRGTVNGVLMDALDCLQELILDGKSVRLGELGLFSIGMTSKAEETADKVTAQSVEGVHLIVRNTKSWSNSELSKKCKLQEYGSYTPAEDEGDDNPSTPSQGDGKGDSSTDQGGGNKGDSSTDQGGGSKGDSGTDQGGGSTDSDGKQEYE